MYPMIKPALRRGWHDRETVRYGVTPAHAVLLGPLDTATETFITLLDGTRGLPQLRDAAARLGLGAAAADRLTGRLAAAGVLEDAAADRAAATRISERQRPDLAAQSLLSPAPGAGLTRLTARRDAWVQVRGAGRVGAALAVALAQAGVGRVEVVDGGRVEAADTSPGGIPAGYVGRRRDGAARTVVRAALPWQGRGPRGGPRRVHLVVVAPRDGVRAYIPDPLPAEGLVAAGTPHLYAGVVEATGFVGPLVIPGVSCCGACLLLHRSRREPGLPLLVGQWRSARPAGAAACDAALAVAVAGLAAATAVGYVDAPGSVEAGVRSELSLPELEMTRRLLPPHPDCDCGARGEAGDPSPGQGDRPVPAAAPRASPRGAAGASETEAGTVRAPKRRPGREGSVVEPAPGPASGAPPERPRRAAERRPVTPRPSGGPDRPPERRSSRRAPHAARARPDVSDRAR